MTTGDERDRRRAVNELMRHELRTRLAVGRGYLATLRASYDAMTPDQRSQAIAGSAAAFDVVERFARRLLLDEQLTLGDVIAKPVELAAARVVSPVRATYPGVTVEAEGTLLADAWLAGEVVENYVSNALAVGSTVTLSVQGGRIEVRDDGPGVPPGERDQLWQRYFRTSRSIAEREPGLGLGLAIVQRIAELHGGACGVSWDPTTFWAELTTSSS